jgi:hypothetical protein
MKNLNQEQVSIFEELLEQARMEYPDALDYSLQLLCYKIALDGNLDTNVSQNLIEAVRNKYESCPTIVYTE